MFDAKHHSFVVASLSKQQSTIPGLPRRFGTILAKAQIIWLQNGRQSCRRESILLAGRSERRGFATILAKKEITKCEKLRQREAHKRSTGLGRDRELCLSTSRRNLVHGCVASLLMQTELSHKNEIKKKAHKI